jgi:hypothetical protein
MSLILKMKSESTFKPVPEGTHLARCYRIIELGTQRSTYLGQVKNQKKIMFQFEVHGEDENGFALVTRAGEPMSISKNYTASLDEKATLRKDLTLWQGHAFSEEEIDKGFDVKKYAGMWGMISVIKAPGADGKEYTNIKSITPVPPIVKKHGLPQHFNEVKIFDIDEPDMELFGTLSDYLRGKIESSPEWRVRKKSKPVADDLDEDIPF